MKWKEVRSIYPDQFVKFEVLKSHFEDDFEYVDGIAVIGPITDDEATKKLLQAKGNVLAYHTSKDNVVLQLRTRIGIRGSYKKIIIGGS